MSKNKLQKFADVRRFSNVHEITDFESQHEKPRGKWNSEIFTKNQPITLELACGKGEYTLELARNYQGRNFIGVDIKGARIWKGAKQALEEELENVRFLRIYIDHVEEYFAPGEVDEIWITFPDPYPKRRDKKKRLTSPQFLRRYKNILTEMSKLHLKTDSSSLFDYTLGTLEELNLPVEEVIRDVHRECSEESMLRTVTTFYEKQHLEDGKIIKYVRFRLNSTM